MSETHCYETYQLKVETYQLEKASTRNIDIKLLSAHSEKQ